MRLLDLDLAFADRVISKTQAALDARDEAAARDAEYQKALPVLNAISSRFDYARQKRLIPYFVNPTQFEQCLRQGLDKNISYSAMQTRHTDLRGIAAALESEIKSAEAKAARAAASRQKAVDGVTIALGLFLGALSFYLPVVPLLSELVKKHPVFLPVFFLASLVICRAVSLKRKAKTRQAAAVVLFLALMTLGIKISGAFFFFNPEIVFAGFQNKPASGTETNESKTVTATVISDYLNLRSGPSVNNQALTQVKKGDVLTVTGEIEHGWVPVEFNGKAGYVSAEMVRFNERE